MNLEFGKSKKYFDTVYVLDIEINYFLKVFFCLLPTWVFTIDTSIHTHYTFWFLDELKLTNTTDNPIIYTSHWQFIGFWVEQTYLVYFGHMTCEEPVISHYIAGSD